MKKNDRPLFIFEMANNHQGSIEHGKRIIKAISDVCRDYPMFDFAFKFQYRDLDTFIHKDYKERFDIKNIKRFQDTRLSQEQFGELLDAVRDNGFLTICTPFDEISVDRIVAQNYDTIKIASCSFTDWPLLEKIATAGKPVIASGAGSSLQEVRNVVSFFVNRGIDLTLMHCVAEYPTANESLQLNQIDLYRREFPTIRIGFSTHESPENTVPVRMAVSKGASVFEKHVGVPTDEISLNAYSANPEQVRAWLAAAAEAYAICGVSGERYESSKKEQADLCALRRGVFVKGAVAEGEELKKDQYYLAFPSTEGQLTASDLSKYNRIFVKSALAADAPIMLENVEIRNERENILEVIQKVLALLKDGNVVVPVGSSCELSHHYGIRKYAETGVAMIECVNREYCKKILVVLPGQSHPSHYHVKKEESFIVLHGDLELTLDGSVRRLKKGDVITVQRGVEHSFASEKGCIFEEISSTHYSDDSFYEKASEFVSPRKTQVHFTEQMLEKINEDGSNAV